MSRSTSWLGSIRGMAMTTVVVALILWSWSIPEVFAALGARNIGKPFAAFRFILLWAGLAVVACRGRTASRRFAGFGWVFVAVLVCPIFVPHLDIGMMPDYPFYGQVVLVVGAIALFVSGGIAWLIEGRQVRDKK